MQGVLHFSRGGPAPWAPRRYGAAKKEAGVSFEGQTECGNRWKKQSMAGR